MSLYCCLDQLVIKRITKSQRRALCNSKLSLKQALTWQVLCYFYVSLISVIKSKLKLLQLSINKMLFWQYMIRVSDSSSLGLSFTSQFVS